MLDYFNKELALNKGRVLDPSFINIRSVVIKYHNTIRERHISSVSFAKPNHLLIKIIRGMSINPNSPPAGLNYYVRNAARAMAPALRVTSDNSRGTCYEGEFIPDCSESIIFTYDSFDKSNWKDLEPVKYLYHTGTNINYEFGATKIKTAFAFISINVPMLINQYLSWYHDCRRQDITPDIHHFVNRYPIFNSLKSYMDISLFNRHYYTVDSRVYLDDDKVNTYPTPAIEDKVEHVKEKVFDELGAKDHTFGGYLYSVPSFFNDNALDIVDMPFIVSSQYTNWFIFAARAPYLHYAMLMAERRGNCLDNASLGNIAREIKALLNSGTLSQVPKHLKIHIIDTYLEEILLLSSTLK